MSQHPFLKNFKLWSVRNLAYFELEDLSQINLIIGSNGTGKTSILEAIYLLSLGRSFRTKLFKKIITHGKTYLTVQGDLSDQTKLGFQKNYDAKSIIRINGDTKKSILENTLLLPVQLIEPNTFAILQSTPDHRRKFIDWGVYQSFPEFYSYWREYHQLLKQRNAAIRNKMPIEIIRVWDPQLSKVTHFIDDFRNKYLLQYAPIFKKYFSILLGDQIQIDLNYYPGWSGNYSELIESRIIRDLELGYTHAGPHRFDLKIKANHHQVADFFSRGQQKLTVVALKIAQAALFLKNNNKSIIFLLDDIASELDTLHRNQLASLLQELSCQCVMTGVEENLLRPFKFSNYSVYTT